MAGGDKIIDELSHPATIFVSILDEDIFKLHQRAHRTAIKSDFKMIKGIILTYLENRSTPLLCASEKTYKIDIDRMTEEQIKELFEEWIYYD